MSKKSNENKESVVRDIASIICALAMTAGAILLACIGEFECALLSLILVRLMLMEK